MIYRIFPFLSIAFQVWMLVDCIRRREERYWIWLIVLLPPIGPLAYFFAVKFPEYQKSSWFDFGFADRRKIKVLEYRLTSTELPQARLELAELYYKQSNWEKAIENYRKVLERDVSPKIQHKLAICLAHQGDYEQAIGILEAVLEKDLDFEYGQAALSLAKCYEASGNSEKAMAAYEYLTKRYSYGEVKYRYAQLLHRGGKQEEALRLMREIVAQTVTLPAYRKKEERVWIRGAKRFLARNQ